MCKTPTNRRRQSTGYTLIEVLITVSIMGIAAAIVVPNMLQGGTLGVQAASRMVIADLMFAQNEAMAQQSTRRVTFDADDNSYKVEKYDANAGEWVLENNPVLGGVGGSNYEIDLDDDRRFRDVEIVSASFNGSNQIEFHDLGNPSSGGTVRLRFETHVYDVNIAPFTGRITVERVD
ncbi:MAG: GspH/FimT family pseudopilin [Phycisphaeraceae bacterium]